MSKQEVILCESLETSLSRAIEQCPHDNFHDLRPRPVKLAGNHAGSILIIPEISCNKALHRLICNLHSAVCIHFVSSSAVCSIPVQQA